MIRTSAASAMNDSSHQVKKPGTVYTFYSYKGGAGRSMALASVGVLLALEQHRVLLVDFDLEAPGLEAFFYNNDACKVAGRPEETPGVLDLLEGQQKAKSISWRECLLRSRFLGGEIDIISAGRKSEDYRKRVQQLNWNSL